MTKYSDPSKWDNLPDEPDEQEYDRLAREVGWEFGNDNCYDGTNKRNLTNKQKEYLRHYYKPKRDYDDFDVKLGLVEASELDPIVAFIDQTPIIENVHLAEFKWTWQTTKNDSRSRIRLGHLETATQKFMLWGFESWQEFNRHLHISDKFLAKSIYDELSTELVLSDHKAKSFNFCFWIVKDEKATTHPGFWAISVDTFEPTTGRDIIGYANEEIFVKDNLIFQVKKSIIGLKNHGKCEKK